MTFKFQSHGTPGAARCLYIEVGNLQIDLNNRTEMTSAQCLMKGKKMSLKNLKERELVSCGPDSTILEAAQLMKRKNVGAVLVMDNARNPLGIITDRDIAIRCVAGQSDCSKARVADAMSKPVQSVRVSEGVYNAIQTMKESGVRRVPVVDEFERAVAVVSFGDLLQMLVQEFSDLTASTTASESKLIQKAA